ncbi:hypothetical protein OROGR_017500 [Orobanche gracilis]
MAYSRLYQNFLKQKRSADCTVKKNPPNFIQGWYSSRNQGKRLQHIREGTIMVVPVVLYYNGTWMDEYEYKNFQVTGILLPETNTLSDMQYLIQRTLNKLDRSSFTMKFQMQSKIPAIVITNESTFKFYMEICKNNYDHGRYPLIVEESEPLLLTSYRPDCYEMQSTLHTTSSVSLMNPSSQVIPIYTDGLHSTLQYAEKVANFIIANDKPLHTQTICDVQENNIIWSANDVDVKKHQIYANKEVLLNATRLHAMRHHRQHKVQRSSGRDYVIVCVEHLKCPWKLRASKIGKTSMFKVREIYDVHTCSSDILMGNHRQATSELVSECVKGKLTCLKKIYTPSDIVEDMKDKYNVLISYQKAWRSKERALVKVRGNPHDYSKITSWLHMAEITNPGTLTDILLDAKGRFRYLFFALGPSIEAWKYCFPIIVVDGTFINSAYMGTLLAASTQDANRSIIPIAFAVVDSENEDSWTWFFKNLRKAIGVRPKQCIVSDRHHAIVKGLEAVFPDVMHGACTYHVLKNIKKRFKKGGVELKNAYNGACRAYTIDEFNKNMADLDAIDIRIRPFLETEVMLNKCTRLHGETSRYSTMTSNIAESLNNAIKVIRDLPIITMIECLRCLVQQWYFANKEAAISTFTTLATNAEKRLAFNINESKKLKVVSSNLVIFIVYDVNKEYIVDISKKTCTCEEFQYQEMPCKHAAAALRKRNFSCYDYCSTLYTKSTLIATYCSSIMPLGDQDNWIVPEHIKSIVVLPPQSKRPPGRPKVGRYKSSLEGINQVQCGKCKGRGHNRKTCKNPPVLHTK